MLAELIDLKQYLISEVTVNADIGTLDDAPEAYPYISILPDRDMELFYMRDTMSSITFPVTLKILVSRGNEIEALEILEKMLKKLNQFNSHKGHQFTDTISPEYTENNYEINVGYNLKLIIQDT